MNITRIEWIGDRFYKVLKDDGDIHYYPSVTTCLDIINKPFLQEWRGRIGNDEADAYLKAQAERGSKIHSGFETLLNNGIVLYNPKLVPNFNSGEIDNYKQQHGNIFVTESSEEMYVISKLKKFLEVVKPKVLLTEKTVYSHDLECAGTLDGLVEIQKGLYYVNGRMPVELESGVYLIDLKTGNSISEEYYLQVAAYAHCVVEMGLAPYVEGALIIHTNSKNKNGIEGLGTKVRSHREMLRDLEVFRTVVELWNWKNWNEKPKIFEVPAMIK